MKKSKKLLSGLLSLMMIFSSAFIINAADTDTVEKAVSLLDLSGLSSGEISELPDGMASINAKDIKDNYTGSRHIAAVDGKKVLRQNFDVKASAFTKNNLSETGNGKLALTVNVPSAYLPYLEYISLDYNNATNSNLRFEFGIYNGTNYSKKTDVNDRLEGNVKYSPLNLYKVGEWGAVAWMDKNSAVKWKKEDLSTVKQLFLIVSTPESGCDGTEGYYLDIKDIAITIKGSRDELNAAEAAAAEAWKTLYDFEGYADGSSVMGENVIKSSEYAASGTNALKFVNTSTNLYGDRDLWIPLNSYVKKATGISFWIYNDGETAVNLKIRINNAENKEGFAQAVFSAPAKKYAKCFISFKNCGEKGDKYGSNVTSGKILSADEISSIANIIITPRFTHGKNWTFYFDDVKYEQDAEHTYSKTVPITADNVNLTGAARMVIEDGKIIYTPTKSETTETNCEKRVADNEAVTKISVDSGFFAGAYNIVFNVTNELGVKTAYGVLLRGKNDNGSNTCWKWGAKWFTETPNTGITTETVRSFDGGSGDRTNFFDAGGGDYYYTSNDAYKKENDIPTPTEKNSITTLEFRLSNFWGTGTFTLNSITVTYAGNTVKAAAEIANGSVSIERAKTFTGDRAGFTLLPEDGYIYKPGSLKIIGTDGREIKVKRDGFRKTNIGYYYAFDMPETDVTVSAEFIPAKTVIISAEANETDKSLKFDLTAATKGGNKVVIEGTEREIISVGALVTTDRALTDYGFEWADLTRELGASSHSIAAVIDDINIGNEGSGLVYDKAHEFIRYNVIIKNLSEESRSADFLVRAYIEYKNENGEKAIAYFDDTTYCYNEMLYGGYYNEAASFSKGISYSGPFEQKVSALSKSNKIFLQETFDDIAAQGFDSVRLPIDFSSNTSDTAPYAIDETLLSYLDTVVKNTLRAGMTIIVDFHQACKLGNTSLYTDPDTVSPKYLAIWQQLAEHYKEYPDRVVFEAINEPGVNTTTFTSAKLMELQEKVLEIVRKTSETRKLMVATGSNNSVKAIENITQNLINDKNVIAAVHCYWPMSFTHQGANWIKNDDGTLKYPGGVKYTAAAKAEVESAIKICKDFSEKNNMAVWLGEFGVYQGGGAAAEDVQAYLSDFTKLCGESKISWCYWEYNVGFGAYDESTGWRGNVLAGLGLGQ